MCCSQVSALQPVPAQKAECLHVIVYAELGTDINNGVIARWKTAAGGGGFLGCVYVQDRLNKTPSERGGAAP